MTPTLAVVLGSLLVLATQAASSVPTSYPVFGTKRYARSNLLPSSDYGGQGGGLPLPLYNLPSARYYDTQLPPQYFPFAPYQAAASSDYYDDSGYYGDSGRGYYYMPQPQHRRYQRNNERYTSYGLPTYRGEYKPTPYYYAPGPSYSYSDDHESSNPLDDLHEEMLQEDERERAREYYPVGQEQWYESPSRPDSAFLRNLILYNQQLQAFSNGRGKAQLPPLDASNEEDFEEYDDPEVDYEYDLPLATDTRPSYGNYFGNPGGYPGAAGYGSSSDTRNTFSKLNSFRNSMARNQIDEEDEEVQELKSLIHQQKNSQRLPALMEDKMSPFILKSQQGAQSQAATASSQKQLQQLQPQHHLQQQQQQLQQLQQQQHQEQLLQRQSKQQLQQLQQQQRLLHQQQQQQQRQEQMLMQQKQKEQEEQKQQQLLARQLQLEREQKQQQQQLQYEREQKQQQLLRTLSSDYQPAYETENTWQKDSPSYNAYDYDTEYDDSWSHWDRKRNVQPKKATFVGKTTAGSALKVTSTTKKPNVPAHSEPSTSSTTVTPAPASKHAAPKPGSGQKEVVLPRPTNPRNLFAATLINAVDESRAQEAAANKAEAGAAKLKQAKSNKIYDTIKAMINMRQNVEDAELRQQLEHQKQLAHIHKRFVANEESLVQELDGLKRSA
uniref:Uncharacterized protein n=1 Tax=Anopheles atroparvus TaxID=41427 RepID=A0AAG5DHJ1_ANOAO